MTPTHQAALEYAARGLRVLPCWPVRGGHCTCGKPTCGKAAGKHPLSALVPRGVKDATADQETIDRWWTQFPDANVAIATGEQSNIFVVDIDPKNGGDEGLVKLVEAVGPTTTKMQATTPNGGVHLYFQWPGKPVRNSVSMLAPGIDVRGENGYVVAAPSITQNGTYQWLEWLPAPDPAPPKLVEQVTGGVSSGIDPLEFTELLNGIPEGRRDVVLFRWASKLRSVGVPQQLAEELVVYGARKCDPPFDEEVAKDKVRRVYQTYHVEFELTDTGNADRLIHRHGKDLRYSTEGQWLVWDGMRWRRDLQTTFVIPYATETIRSILAEARELQGQDEATMEKRAALLSHGYKSEQVDRIYAMVRLAQADVAIQVEPKHLDADPWLLNVENGTLDLRSGRLYHHSQEDLITKVAATAFEPSADAPTWRAFLERVVPDPEIRLFLQKAAGYSLTGGVQEQVMFFLWGPPRAGKSTFAGTLLRLMGEYGTQGTPDLLLADKGDNHPTVLADLTGVRYVPTIEIDQGKRLAEAQFKWLTGGDRLKARRMRQDYYEFNPQFKLWMAANHKPIIRGDDAAVWRRIHLVPFNEVIPLEERDGELPDKLARELPGILNWAVEGCRLWREQGLNPPDAVKAATEEYRSDMDVLGQFLEECLEPVDGKEVPADTLYTVYRQWCKSQGFNNPMTKVALTRALRQHQMPERTAGGRRVMWTNHRLTPEGRTYQEQASYGQGGMQVLDTTGQFMTQGDSSGKET